jgi:phytoene/squalene synthetase
MKFEVNRTKEYFRNGLPILPEVDKRVRVDIEIAIEGGMRILEKIEKINYNIFVARPKLSLYDRAYLLVKALIRSKLSLENPHLV